MKFLLTTILFFLPLIGNSKIVAEVNGEKITHDEFEAIYNERLLYPSHKKISKEAVLKEIVHRRLASKKAVEEKISSEQSVKAKIDGILHSELLGKHLNNKFEAIKVPESEIKSHYKNNKEYRTSHILYRVKALPTKKDLEQSYELMYKIYQQLQKKPDQFAAVAKKYSQVATNKSGGDIGFLPHTSMAPEYYEAIKGKNIGYISQPVRTQFGYHIIKVTGVKNYKDIDQNLYKKIVFDIKRDKIIDDYYASLEKSAKIKLYKENL